MIDYWLVFMTGVLASLHCVGMCGPIVLAYSVSGSGDLPGSATRAGIMRMHGAYNAGRIASYTLLGGAAGLIGRAFRFQIAGDYISLVGGFLLLLAGIALLRVIPVPRWATTGILGKGASRAQAALLRSRSIASKLALGLLTPLLPCGVLYAVVVKAAATQSAARGAFTMTLFALGMAPALMLVGSLSSLLSRRVRRGAERLAAVTVVFMGVILLLRGFHVPYLSWLSSGGEASCPACGH